ncbi:hypothetical protein G5V58_08175 [Nocardioides anomalus]|uniref:WD40 repeat domain-containing protein n=1 Tax=Nocardioides anomalus TaxID=2712223 RepID=A0A6G6WBZ3_9ACTN|nr:hypothetical protein [Nocardioides anomalus]QIG42762.1 hypothetical protein G5V58_08175 [Nocardioides anomalus]
MLRLLACVVPLLAVGLGAPAVAEPAEPPAVAYATGTVVHLPDGSSVTLPVRGRVEVLGRRAGQWLVAVDSADDRVLAVRGRTVRQVWLHRYAEEAVGYQLRRGAAQVVESVTDRGGRTELTVFDLDGDVVGSRAWFDGTSVIGQDDDALYVGFWERPTLRWVPGERSTKVGPVAELADPDHDLLFVATPSGDGDDEDDDQVGPTALSAPGTPAWSADFEPSAVSPDGAWVAGETYRRRALLEVRRVSDGAVVALPALALAGTTGVPVAWEADGDLLAVVGTGGRRWLVRCTVTGDCERVTAPTTARLGLVPR